jgi:hypothetical protein
MLTAGRTQRDYFLASRVSFVVLLVLSGVNVIGRLTGYFSVFVNYLQFIGFPLIGWAGWWAVRKHGFNLTQTAIVGFILSFASHWALLIFHSAVEIVWLFVVNSIIFIAVALCGGFIAKKTRIP